MSAELPFEFSMLNISLEPPNDRITDKIVKQLAEDANSIDMILYECRNQRLQTSDRQKSASHAYEEDMIRIEQGARREEEAQLQHVDHAIMRHINANYRNDDAEDSHNEIQVGEYGDNFDDGVDQIFDGPQTKLQPPIVELGNKRNMPSANEKLEIRKHFFEFMDQSQIEEQKLEEEFELAKRQNKHKEAAIIVEKLSQVQLQNVSKFKTFLSVYQPAPFGKAWGTDPDYLALTKKLKKGLKSMHMDNMPSGGSSKSSSSDRKRP